MQSFNSPKLLYNHVYKPTQKIRDQSVPVIEVETLQPRRPYRVLLADDEAVPAKLDYSVYHLRDLIYKDGYDPFADRFRVCLVKPRHYEYPLDSSAVYNPFHNQLIDLQTKVHVDSSDCDALWYILERMRIHRLYAEARYRNLCFATVTQLLVWPKKQRLNFAEMHKTSSYVSLLCDRVSEIEKNQLWFWKEVGQIPITLWSVRLVDKAINDGKVEFVYDNADIDMKIPPDNVPHDVYRMCRELTFAPDELEMCNIVVQLRSIFQYMTCPYADFMAQPVPQLLEKLSIRRIRNDPKYFEKLAKVSPLGKYYTVNESPKQRPKYITGTACTGKSTVMDRLANRDGWIIMSRGSMGGFAGKAFNANSIAALHASIDATLNQYADCVIGDRGPIDNPLWRYIMPSLCGPTCGDGKRDGFYRDLVIANSLKAFTEHANQLTCAYYARFCCALFIDPLLEENRERMLAREEGNDCHRASIPNYALVQNIAYVAMAALYGLPIVCVPYQRTKHCIIMDQALHVENSDLVSEYFGGKCDSARIDEVRAFLNTVKRVMPAVPDERFDITKHQDISRMLGVYR